MSRTRRGFLNGEYQDGEARGRIFICGQSGYGKTTEMIRLCEQCSGGVVLYDHTSQHSLQGGRVVHDAAALVDGIRKSLAAGREGFRFVYQPRGGDLTAHFRRVCEVANFTAGMVLAVDEVDFYCESTFGPSRMPPELYKLIHFGRHAPGSEVTDARRRGVAMLYTARIPTSVARALSSQASEFRLFHEDDGEYLDFFRRGVLRNRENTERLRELPKFKFFRVWKDGAQPMELRSGARAG